MPCGLNDKLGAWGDRCATHVESLYTGGLRTASAHPNNP